MASLSLTNKLPKGTNTQLWFNSSAIDMQSHLTFRYNEKNLSEFAQFNKNAQKEKGEATNHLNHLHP